MGYSKEHKIKTAILTVSTSCFKKQRKDESGKVLAELCAKNSFRILSRDIVSDDKRAIGAKLRFYSDELKADVVFTTGGTGMGPYDLTPEATSGVCDRIVPGIPELIRAQGIKKTKMAVLSRGTCGIRKKTLIINLPGSPKAVKESFDAISGIIPHSIEIISGKEHG